MAAQTSTRALAAGMEDVEVTVAKLPHSFKKAMTQTNTKKRGSSLAVPMKDSRVCWAVGLREELEIVMKGPEDGKEEKWAVTWHSGRRKHRNDCILMGGWQPFALHYKLAPKDVLAFTILTPSLVSVLIVKRHYPCSPLLALPKTPHIPQLEHKQHSLLEDPDPSLQLTNRALACSPPMQLIKPLQCTPSRNSRKALCYIKVKPNHLQGDSLLLDIPLEFAKQVGKAYWGIEDKNHSRSALPIQKLVLGHQIEEGDLCIFELNAMSEAYALHVYIYKKDRGKPNIITITLTNT